MNPLRLLTTTPARLIGRIVRDQRGGTAMEYGLILSLVVLCMLVALIQLAGTTTGMWNSISAKVTAAR